MFRPLPLPPVPFRTLPSWNSACDKEFPGPHTGVKPGRPKKFSAVLFEDCLRLLGGLDHFLRLVALEARKLYNSHDLIPPLRPLRLSLGVAAEVHRDPISDKESERISALAKSERGSAVRAL